MGLTAKRGTVLIALVLTLAVLAIFSGCAQSQTKTYRLVDRGPAVRMRFLDTTDALSFRPIEARVTSHHGRHTIWVAYEFTQGSSGVINRDRVDALSFGLRSRDVINYTNDGKPLRVYKASQFVRDHPPKSFVNSTSVDAEGRTITIASVPSGQQFVHHRDLVVFDLTLDQDALRTITSRVFRVTEDQMSVVASEPEARWSFALDRSR